MDDRHHDDRTTAIWYGMNMNCLTCQEPIATGKRLHCSLCQALDKLGFTYDLYKRLYDEQGGKCRICGYLAPFRDKGRLVLDHCHTTHRARGLLCSSCNVGIGALRDNAQIVLSAYRYLVEERDMPVATSDRLYSPKPRAIRPPRDKQTTRERLTKGLTREQWLWMVERESKRYGW